MKEVVWLRFSNTYLKAAGEVLQQYSIDYEVAQYKPSILQVYFVQIYTG